MTNTKSQTVIARYTFYAPHGIEITLLKQESKTYAVRVIVQNQVVCYEYKTKQTAQKWFEAIAFQVSQFEFHTVNLINFSKYAVSQDNFNRDADKLVMVQQNLLAKGLLPVVAVAYDTTITCWVCLRKEVPTQSMRAKSYFQILSINELNNLRTYEYTNSPYQELIDVDEAASDYWASLLVDSQDDNDEPESSDESDEIIHSEVPTIDCDEVYHEVMDCESKSQKQIACDSFSVILHMPVGTSQVQVLPYRTYHDVLDLGYDSNIRILYIDPRQTEVQRYEQVCNTIDRLIANANQV